MLPATDRKIEKIGFKKGGGSVSLSPDVHEALRIEVELAGVVRTAGGLGLLQGTHYQSCCSRQRALKVSRKRARWNGVRFFWSSDAGRSVFREATRGGRPQEAALVTTSKEHLPRRNTDQNTAV